jgi:hypothetical protein
MSFKATNQIVFRRTHTKSIIDISAIAITSKPNRPPPINHHKVQKTIRTVAKLDKFAIVIASAITNCFRKPN